MLEILNYVTTIGCPVCLVIICLMYCRLSVIKSKMKEEADEKIAALRKAPVTRNSPAFTIRSPHDLKEKELQFEVERLMIHAYLTRLTNTVKEMRASNTSSILYHNFLDEMTPTLKNSNRNVSVILDKYYGIDAKENMN
jgi:hypothetical protein